MESTNLDAAKQEYIKLVNKLSSLMMEINEIKPRASELEKIITELSKDSNTKEIIQVEEKKLIP